MKNQEKFIELIIKKEKAIEAGNAKIANINYDKISKIVEDWRRIGSRFSGNLNRCLNMKKTMLNTALHLY